MISGFVDHSADSIRSVRARITLIAALVIVFCTFGGVNVQAGETGLPPVSVDAQALESALLRTDSDIVLPDGPAHAHVIARQFENDGHEVIRFAIGDAVSTISIANGTMLGHVWSENLNEYLVSRGPNGYDIRAVKPRDFECRVVDEPANDRASSAEILMLAPATRRRAVTHQPPAEITVLLLRVTGELPALGDEDARLRFGHVVDLMNTALINSGLSWIHFVAIGVDHIVVPSDVERNPTGNEALRWLTDPSNTVVSALRQQYRADLVTLDAQRSLVASAFRPRPGQNKPSLGFAVTDLLGGGDASGGDQDYAMTTLHEWGHNLGGDHNPEDESIPASQDPAPYARCFYHCGAGAWRGPLSYGIHCGTTPETAADCVPLCSPTAPRYPIFSNPAVTFRGVPAGVPGRQDNAHAFELIAPAVARYFPK